MNDSEVLIGMGLFVCTSSLALVVLALVTIQRHENSQKPAPGAQDVPLPSALQHCQGAVGCQRSPVLLRRYDPTTTRALCETCAVLDPEVRGWKG